MRLALVLSGGGSKGAFEAGVIAAVFDAGLTPDILTGTSAGALNAAGLAAGLGATGLADVWTSVTDSDVYRQRHDLWNLVRPAGLFAPGNLAEKLLSSIGWTWLWDSAPLRDTLIDALGGTQVPDTGVPLVLTAVQVTSGRLVVFATQPPRRPERADLYRVGPVSVDELLSSAAIPLLFKPGRVASTAFWDGGVLANTPLDAALDYEPDAAIVVTTATLERPAPEPRSLTQAVGLVIDASRRHALEAALGRAEAVNALCRASSEAAGGRRPVDLLIIDPRGLDLGDPLHFDPAQARRLIGLGRRVGAEAIARWRAPKATATE